MGTHETTSLQPTRSVALDIGGDVGALVIVVDAALEGHEVEARPLRDGARPRHAAAIRRTGGAEDLWAVVIDGLASGPHTVWLDGSTAWGHADVTGGTVTQLDRRAPAAVIDVTGAGAILAT